MADLPRTIRIPAIWMEPPQGCHRYITRVAFKQTTLDAEYSMLESAVLERLAGREDVWDIPPGTRKVDIFELVHPINPTARTIEAYQEAYKGVQKTYLEKDGEMCDSADSLGNIPPERLVAVVYIVAPSMEPPEHHLDAVAYEHLIEYKGVFIKVHAFGRFNDDDLQLNQVSFTDGSLPRFVHDFKDKLVIKPRISRYLECDDSAVADEYEIFGRNVEQTMETDDNSPRTADQLETKLVNLVASNWERLWGFGQRQIKRPFKQDIFDALFFFGVMLRVLENGKLVTKRHTDSWSFHLIMMLTDMHEDSNITTEGLRTLLPKSDFSLLKCGLPRLIVEVNSGPSAGERAPDHVRLLLEGAAIVRFANMFVDAFKSNKSFVLVAIFLTEDGAAIRYLGYQEHGSDIVHYSTDTFDLKMPRERVRFTCGLHNLVHALEAEEDDDDTEVKVTTFKEKVKTAKWKLKLKSFHTKPRSRKRKRTGNDNDAGGGDGPGGGAGAADAEADVAVLKSKGFTVVPNVIVDDRGCEWEQLFELPAHILRVYKGRNENTTFIAKKVRKDSDEVKILQLLGSVKPGCEHVISMLDSIDTPSGCWIILPTMTSVDEYLELASARLLRQVVRICTGLIEGLGYVHGMHISHGDIKPANLVVDGSFCLKIIDFDLGIQVKDEDSVVDEFRGTEDWTAPEVYDYESSAYSPIRADRWSCGRVILYLLDKAGKMEAPLRSFATELKADNPQQRPSLVEWRMWKLETAASSIVIPQVRPHSPLGAESDYGKRPRMATSGQNGHPLSDLQRLGIRAEVC